MIDPNVVLDGYAHASSNTGLWTPTLVAAIVAASISLTTFGLAGRRARIDRQRQVFADAFGAVIEYREYPYIVHRRNGAESAKERQRISNELSKVQAKLNEFEGRLFVEDPHIGKLYAEVVRETRRIAGAMIKQAWNSEAIVNDSEIHAPKYDFSGLNAPDEAYLHAVADHLAWFSWLRRKWRSHGRS